MLSIIIPTLNESKNIKILARRIKKAMNNHKIDYELIVVDDNSSDKTFEVAKKLEKKYNIKAFKRIKDKGLSSAVVFGFSKARGDIICVIDADLSHPPELIPRMLKEIKKNDIVVASRLIKGGKVEDWPMHRKLMSKFATSLANPLSSVNDKMSGFFMIKKKVIKNIHFVPRGYKILLEILVKGNYENVKEIPYTFKNRKVGTSKLTIKTNLEYLVQLLHLYRVKFLR